jgi:hypothetical protein
MTRYLISFPAPRWTTSPLTNSPPWERLLMRWLNRVDKKLG